MRGNINLITQFFLEILESLCKLVIFANLTRPSYTHQYWWYEMKNIHIIVVYIVYILYMYIYTHAYVYIHEYVHIYIYLHIYILCTYYMHKYIYIVHKEVPGHPLFQEPTPWRIFPHPFLKIFVPPTLFSVPTSFKVF